MISDSPQKTIALFESLPPFEKSLLQLISIIYEPVSVIFLHHFLAKAESLVQNIHTPAKEELQETLLRLRQLKLLDKQHRCAHPLVEYLTRNSLENGTFPAIASLVEKEAPVSYMYGKWTTRCWRAMRQFRIGIYSRDFDKIDESLKFLEAHCLVRLDNKSPAVIVAAEAFDVHWFGGLPGSMQFFLLDQIIRYSTSRLQHYQLVLDYLEDESALTVSGDEQVPFHRMLAGYLILQGRFEELQNLLDSHGDSFLASGFSGTLAFIKGDTEKALQLYAGELEQLREFSGDKNSFFFGLPGLFCVLALLARNRDGDIMAIKQHVASVLTRFKGCPEEVPFRFVEAVVSSMGNGMPDMMVLTEHLKADDRSLTKLLAVLCLYWMDVEIPDDFKKSLVILYQKSSAQHFAWFSMEVAALLSALDVNTDEYGKTAEKLGRELGCRSIVNIIQPEKSWKHSLQELISLTSTVREREKSARLVWLVKYANGILYISPKEQKRKVSGKWSKGRSISLSRLADHKNLDFLSVQDRQICASLKEEEEDISSKNGGLVFVQEIALPALIGHPFVFLEESPQTPVEIVAGKPELLVEQQDDFLFINFTQDIGEGNIAVWQETPTRFKVIEIDNNHRRVAAITGPDGLRIPVSASKQVLEAIGKIASFMTVHSSVGVDIQGQSVEFFDADPTIHLHFIPYGSGFRLEMFVQPFSSAGPYLKPGAGVANIMAEVNGRRLQTQRNLKLEEEKAREIEESCPILDLAIDLEQENEREWHMLDPEECLQALLELEEIRDKIILEWPEGGKLTVRRQAGVNQLNLNIRTSQQDWFGLSGVLEINQDEVIELKTLLDKVQSSRSRFIPIGDTQFLALTQEFRKRLEELILYSEAKGAKKDEVYVHPLAAIALEELTQGARTNADKGWQRQLDHILEAQEMVPEVPSTLQAELRDYQVEGFVWMARLAHLDVGACLADDMGLGKTLQALAVILSMAKEGPTLVISPTSVCMNWEQEIMRFAPTLKIKFLSGADRKKVVGSLKKFDILISSYTLLQQEIDLLEEVSWQTIVLDEAQAIKNAGTKRSKAAMRLKGRFKLITTGTPIENHLGELWNLFRFINPGLLGSFKQFNARFGIPIEKHHDREARRKLKKIIRPFMLRRIKSQVLDELPPRTEVTLRVEMKPDEVRFYEALRQQALENIESSAEKSGRHLQILAEIMKLRRCCCNPRLIMPDTKISSTKLEVFSKVVEELIRSRHKALVFSQFTGHLALIREYLDKQGIVYKYLDGTTPARERQNQVESFQEGEGDLFLISLKAGGLGLNLTAADYVLHMDPWWNPAVEDQAADRAHRIGQKRPVTVYRLVTANTIEEKIVRLHQEKRDLANSLLEGADVSARISADELLELIREN